MENAKSKVVNEGYQPRPTHQNGYQPSSKPGPASPQNPPTGGPATSKK